MLYLVRMLRREAWTQGASDISRRLCIISANLFSSCNQQCLRGQRGEDSQFIIADQLLPLPLLSIFFHNLLSCVSLNKHNAVALSSGTLGSGLDGDGDDSIVLFGVVVAHGSECVGR